ncbi:MAG: hypothetical protein ACPGQL_01680 [Thermoplasmatota archaeon]
MAAAVLLVASTSAAIAGWPANDDFADAIVVTVPRFEDTQDMLLATTESDEPWPSCMPALAGATQEPSMGTAWYRYTAPAQGTLRATTLESDHDTVLAAYAGTTLATLDAVACNDDTRGGDRSELLLDVAAGQTLHFQVAGGLPGIGWPLDTERGELTFDLAFGTPPAHDDFLDARHVDQQIYGDAESNEFAGNEAGEPLPCGRIANTVWYEYTAPDQVGSILAHTREGPRGLNTAIVAYTGDSLGTLSRLDCGAGGSGNADVRFRAEPATRYLFQVGGQRGDTGPLHFYMEWVSFPDDFADAQVVSALPFATSADTTVATSEVGEPQPCGQGIGKTVWYRYDAPHSGTVTVSSAGSTGFSPTRAVLTVYEGASLGGLTKIACSDQRAEGDVATFDATAGHAYYVQAGGRSSASGQLELTFTE